MQKYSLLLLLFTLFSAHGISQNELNELTRKFKYYHSAVRPAAPENFLSNRNGTFFNIPVEIHLLSSRISNRNLYIEVIIVMSWIDERLRLRELTDRFSMPAEYPSWQPALIFSPVTTSRYSTLSPTSGIISYYNTLKTTLECTAQYWKYPFETFTCSMSVTPEGDEILTVTTFHDLRSDSQKIMAPVMIGDYPSCNIDLFFKAEWPRAFLSAYLPSVLIVSAVFFAQWKRRKIQVLVSLAAMISILIMMCSQRPYTAATLMDLWLCANFIHTIFLVFTDLTLPARRVRYTLMVHVDERSKTANPVKIMTKSETEHTGPFRYMNQVMDCILSRDRKPKTTIVTASPGATPIQRQITTSMLGNRKRVALLCIAMSYIVFIFFYFIIILVID